MAATTINGRTRHVAKALLDVAKWQAALGDTVTAIVAGEYQSTVTDLAFLQLTLDHLEQAVAGAQMVVSYAHHQAVGDREREDEQARVAQLDEEWGPDSDRPWAALKDEVDPVESPAGVSAGRS